MQTQNPESRFWEIDAKLGAAITKAEELCRQSENECESCNGTGWLSRICGACNGSGEGMHDGSRCFGCKGSGKVSTHCECQINDDDLVTILIDE